MQYKYTTNYAVEDNKKANDRILTLAPDGDVKDVTGMVDHDLFKGGNRLHCVMDSKTTLWSFHYDKGILAGPLKQRFTSFSKALEHAKAYYATRNVKITQVED